ncbi:hypothetical protein EPN96_08320 [bacterium]|nr:MAG: hypothetical protein EPN96_08320 [bacterium]
MLEISREAAELLDRQQYLREIDRSGRPHFLIKVPDLKKASEAELGIEIVQSEEGCLVVTLLIYDIPAEPVACDIVFHTKNSEDVAFLQALIDSVVFHFHPCAMVEGKYSVGQPVALRLPPNLHLRLKHYSRDFHPAPAPDQSAQPLVAETGEIPPAEETSNESPAIRNLKSAISGSDARDTVIKKLKEQVQTLRQQVKEKEKRIIELEDQLGDFKSGKRQYRLGAEKKSWWNPF